MISNTLTLKQLEALVWVADLGSFRKAAAHLGTTQPNISARIAALETTLGFSLMARNAGSVEMTPRGLDVLEQARKSLRAVEGVLDVAARPDLAEDRLRLGVTELIATTWLHDFLRALRQDYPRVTVELTVDLSRTLDAELAANALDLALQNAPFSHAATGEITLGSYGYAWVAAPDLMSGIDPSTGISGLTAPILTHARHTQAFQELQAHLAPGPAPRLVPSSSLNSAILMAVNGMGVAMVPRAMVAGHLAGGTLAEVDLGWQPEPLDFAARFHAERAAGVVRKAADLAARVAVKDQLNGSH